MTAHLHADPCERSADRRGNRNGYKSRQLNTRVGTLTLQVPQDRDGTFSTQVFTRYQRNEKALVLALMEMYVEGVSTRKVREITEVLCGTSFSKSLVSELGLPHETEKIVRQGGDGKKHERRSMAACQTEVYPNPHPRHETKNRARRLRRRDPLAENRDCLLHTTRYAPYSLHAAWGAGVLAHLSLYDSR